MVITDIGGNIEHVNPTFTQITGYQADEVLGKNPRILQSGKTSQQQYSTLWSTILAGEVWQNEIVNRKKQGFMFPVAFWFRNELHGFLVRKH